MDLGIKRKKAIVTGAGRGIGRAIAIRLAQEGVTVGVISRTKDDLKEVVEKMGGKKRGHVSIVADLTKKGVPQKIYKEIKYHLGEIDIVVNNVGDALNIKDPLCPLEDWRRVFRMNLEIAIEFNNLVIPYIRRKHWGRIVNIGSTASLENNGPIPYCSAKAALLAYSRSLGRILATEGIVLSTVLPGAVIAPGSYWEKAQKEKPEHVERYIKERLPLGRFAQPEEISGMAVFLCSELASFCQGAIVPVDGGQSRHYFGAYNLGD